MDKANNKAQLKHDAKLALKKDVMNYMHLNDYQVMSPQAYNGFIQDIKAHLRYNISTAKSLLHQNSDYRVAVNKLELQMLKQKL